MRSTANEYKISYKAITVLIGLYVCMLIYNNKAIPITRLVKTIGYYSYNYTHKCIDVLISSLLVEELDNKFIITQRGIDTINLIANNSNELVYLFCNKYNIEL